MKIAKIISVFVLVVVFVCFIMSIILQYPTEILNLQSVNLLIVLIGDALIFKYADKKNCDGLE
jgi:hypothetical protein